MNIQVYSCGGTIDKVYFDARSAYEIGDPCVGAILQQANVQFEYRVESLMRKDSLDMTDGDRQLLCDRIAGCPQRQILVTHGTDSMAESALMLAGLADKTIVLTGAMRPARFADSDAAFNVGCAIGALQSLPPGVYIAMNGRAFSAGKVRKNREAGRFEAL
ncbi:MAG: asparaginase [Gammaproteobacteria bacterium]|nr:asparaginase [Gammaproteobacteria bacterium]